MLRSVGGVDTYRGIAYQHVQAVLSALDVLESDAFAAIRVEGIDDVIDIELLDGSGRVVIGKQAKVRSDAYAWSKADLVGLLRRWAGVDAPDDAVFQFVTDGRLGPSGEQVRDALAAAASCRPEALAELLAEDPAGGVVARASRASIVQDPFGTGPLLARAERQVMALLPSARSPADALELARAAVDALSRLLLDRACRPDAAARVVGRDEICDALGIPRTAVALVPWADGALRARYIAAAAGAAGGTVPARIARVGSAGSQSGDPAPVAAILSDAVRVAAVAGPTGAGKSTAAREIRAAGAAAGSAVIVAHAETYLPGRLEALVADAIADVLDQDVPALTGRQVLADDSALLVIDGASEIPAQVRAALADDLRTSVARGRGARVVLLGRDMAALREVLPASCAPALFRMDAFGRDRRQALTASTLGADADDAAVRVLLAQAEEALGDAAGNPMLLDMAVDLIRSGVAFADRAAVYAAFAERLAERTGADGLAVATVVLGACFARLLDEGRRYADPYTWRRLLVEAAAAQEPLIGPVDAGAVDAAARRSGLIVALGHTETVAALHDSFADFLAGLALARRAVAFPADVGPGDEERLVFAAQIGGIDRTFAETVSSRLPFALPRFAPLDTRPLGDDAPEQVAAVLRAVAPPGAPTGVDLWRLPDGRVVAINRADAEGRWLSHDDGRAALASAAWVAAAGGPLDVAVRLWRQQLRAVLTVRGRSGRPRPRTAAEARDAVAAHAADAADHLDRLLSEALPAEHLPALRGEVGPAGLTARIHPAPEHPRGRRPDWTIAYTRTEAIDVTFADGPAPTSGYQAQGTLDSALGASAEAIAADRVRNALNRLTGGRWL